MTAICAFETFEQRLESTLSSHCRSRRVCRNSGGSKQTFALNLMLHERSI
jgi:hypothetical protein